MDLKREKMKKNIFLGCYLVFLLLTILGAIFVVTQDKNAGYAVIPMLFGIISGMLYRNSRKTIEENKKS